MKSLKKTTRWGVGRYSHYHILYLDDESGFGLCGVAANHSHQVIWNPPLEPQVDPNTGQELAPGQPGFFYIEPDPEDGHTHDIVEYETKPVKKKQKDKEVISEVLELYKTALSIEENSRRKGKEADDFYCGEQWKADEKSYLRDLSRACLTINFIAPKIDEVSGHQRQNRTDIHLVPVEEGDQRTCDLYNQVIKVISDQSYLDREESKVFIDECVPGRGVFNVYVDFSRNLFGDIKVERFPWDKVLFGPHEKEDASDAEYLIKHKMFSRAKVEQLWPDKAEDVGVDFSLIEDGAKDSHVQYAFDQYAHSDNKQSLPNMVATEMLVDVAKKEYRVLEVWRKIYVDDSVAVKADEELTFDLSNWETKDKDQIETMPGFVVIPRSKTKIRITKVAGGVVLSDEDPAELPIDDFFLVPVYCYKRGDDFWGKVENIKDPQREINKRRSQAIDIANRMGAYGWGFDAETFASEAEAKKFRENATSPGFVVQLNDATRPPHRFDGVEFPSALVQMMDLDIQNLDRILNISVREPGANTSAAAIMQAQKLKLTGNEFLFDNLSFAKRKVGWLLVHCIRKYYSAERIYKIVSNQNSKTPVQIGGQPLEQFSKEEIIEILENADITKFDVIVSESSYSPSMRLQIFAMLQDWMRAGGQVPPTMLVEYMDIPEQDKQKMKQDIQAQQEAATQAQQATQDGEVLKTLVAQGMMPPEVEQRFFPQGQQNNALPTDIPADQSNGGLAG